MNPASSFLTPTISIRMSGRTSSAELLYFHRMTIFRLREVLIKEDRRLLEWEVSLLIFAKFVLLYLRCGGK